MNLRTNMHIEKGKGKNYSAWFHSGEPPNGFWYKSGNDMTKT